MGAGSGDRLLVDAQRIGLDDLELAGELLLQLGERRDAAPVAFHRDHRSPGIEQRAGQPAGTWADLINTRAVERSGDRRDAREQLPVEDEILPERLARAQAMARDDLSQWLRRRRHA